MKCNYQVSRTFQYLSQSHPMGILCSQSVENITNKMCVNPVFLPSEVFDGDDMLDH